MKYVSCSVVFVFFIFFSTSISAEEQSCTDTVSNIPSSIIQAIGTVTRKVPFFWIFHNTMTCSDCHQCAEDFLIAAKQGDIETVKKCIDMDVRVNIQDKHGNTALHLAAEYGHKEIVQLLLNTRLDTSYFADFRGKRAGFSRNKRCETPFHSAACQDDTTILELLLTDNDFANQ